MPNLRRTLGLVVIVLGIALLALPFVGLITSSSSAPEMSSGSAGSLTPQIYGGGTLKVSWTGAGSQTTVTLYSCPGDSTCGNTHTFAGLTTVASGSGASGSLSASVNGGTTYLLAETGTSGGLTVTESVMGVTTLVLVGIVIAIIGVILVAIPVRVRALTPEEEAEAAAAAAADAAAPEEVMLAAPVSAEMSTSSAPLIGRAPEPEPEAELEAPPVASTAVPAGGSNRPAIKCAHCGTMNEPWITNCRWCKRTLTSTG